MENKLFKYSNKDAFLILYTLVMFSLPIVLALYTPGLLILSVITFFHIWFLVNGQNSSEHHHTHWATFNNEKLNRIYEVLLTATFSIPASLWKKTHLLHHKHVNDQPINGICQDPLSVYQLDPEKGELNNFWIYCFKGAWVFNFKCIFTLYKFGPYTRLRNELWGLRVYLAALLILNPFYGLWYLAVVYLAFVVNNANSYGEHWGALVRRGDTTQDSIGIYSRWYNIFGFNAGLHQEHHHKPGVHWTELPKVTKELHPNRVIKKHGVHITNNPFWDHFVLLLKKQPAIPK